MNVDGNDLSHSERQRQGQRNRSRHQHGRAPVPEPDQRDDHHEADRLIETAHQQADKFLHLLWLVRRSLDDQVRRQLRPHLGQRLVHGLAELENLLSRSHLHGQRDGAIAVPFSIRVARRQIVRIPLRRLVATRDLHQITQMHRDARGRGPDQHVADLLRVLEFGRCIDADVLRLRLDDASGGGHIAGRQHVLDLRGLQVERGEPVVRVIEVDLLGEHPRALDLRDDRHAL